MQRGTPYQPGLLTGACRYLPGPNLLYRGGCLALFLPVPSTQQGDLVVKPVSHRDRVVIDRGLIYELRSVQGTEGLPWMAHGLLIEHYNVIGTRHFDGPVPWRRLQLPEKQSQMAIYALLCIEV